jgi:NTP pyrophosphatase (non-canonical NTP hydrolase)
LRDHKKLFEAGNAAQLEKILRDSHKGDWQELSIEDLYLNLSQEWVELVEAVTTGGFADIRQEAADIANYAHMIIEACDSVLEVEKQG